MRSACPADQACGSTPFAHSECTIPPYYDSLIAKIIVHGRDRLRKPSRACVERWR